MKIATLERPLSLDEALIKFALPAAPHQKKSKRQIKGRVLMISEHADPLARPGAKEVGGQNVYVYHLAKEIGRLGYEVDVYTRWDSVHKRQTVSFGRGVRVIRVKCGPRHYIPRDQIYQHLPEFVDNIIAHKREHDLSYDIIHTHYWMSGWAGLKLRSVWDIPVVATYHSLGRVRHEALKDLKTQEPHNNFFEFRTYWERELANKSDIILSTSEFEVQDIQRHYKPDRLDAAIIPVGIDQKLFRPVNKETARRKIGQPLDAKILLYAGRIEWRKGIETIIEALPTIIQNQKLRKKEVKLLIVGRKVGPERAEVRRLKELAEKMGVLKFITFVGSVDRSDMKYYFSAADVCLVPSYYEPFGIVPQEAFACHCPVIASRVGGLQFTVHHGENGYLIPPKNSKALARYAVRILSGATDMQSKLPELAEEIVDRQLAWPRIATQVEEAYQRIIKRRKDLK